jgi:hypothetical protein
MASRIVGYSLRIAFVAWASIGAPNRECCFGQEPPTQAPDNESNSPSNAIPLLGGFDAARIDAAYPPNDEAAWSEVARLAYRLRSLDPDALSKIISPQGEPAIGDAVMIEGVIESINSQPVPAKLVEYLEMSQLAVIDVRTPQTLIRVISPSIAELASVGDRVSCSGVVIEGPRGDSAIDSGIEMAVVCAGVRWFPDSPQSPGQTLLRDAGFDLSLLSGVASRNRRPLVGEDGEAFYALLAASGAIVQRADLPSPRPTDPVELLRSPKDWIGEWIHLELDSVQVTRVAVPELHRQQQLGRDHYYQLDAVGDLNGVVIKIENSDPSIPPAIFEGRYPVSVVTLELPDFLRDQAFRNSSVAPEQRGQVGTASVRTKFSMDGFFYRLWAYETEFMSHQGGGQQFGPLLVAARMENREPETTDMVGAGRIGAAAAVALLLAIAWIWWWQRRTWSEDAAVRRRRQESQDNQLPLPPA